MADVVRRIGLLLGADLCWPICYEEILKNLELALPIDGDTVRFEVERVSIVKLCIHCSFLNSHKNLPEHRVFDSSSF